MPPQTLNHDPYNVFRSSATPAGLYARQKWLDESSTADWKADFAATVAELYREQSADGLWRGSALETIHRLFALHLTVRHPDARIDKGLDALLGIATAEQPIASPPVGCGSFRSCRDRVRRSLFQPPCF